MSWIRFLNPRCARSASRAQFNIAAEPSTAWKV